LVAGGGVQCWGANTSGQLGDGTTLQRLLPTGVSGLGTGTAAIAAAQMSTCALTSLGGVKCWGANAGSATPVDISGLTSGIVEIGIGGNFACVLTQSSAIQCWGDNSNGRLGDGTTIAHSAPANVVAFGGSDLLNQSISFAALPDRPAGSPPFAVSATAGSSLPMIFSSITPGVCSVSGNIVTLIAAGACTIAANQTGDDTGTYADALQVTRTFRVTSTQSTQTISGFTPTSPIPYAANGGFTLFATGGGSGNPVVFASITPETCTVTGSVAHIIASGTCTLTANQAGNAGFSAAPQVTATVIISKAN